MILKFDIKIFTIRTKHQKTIQKRWRPCSTKKRVFAALGMTAHQTLGSAFGTRVAALSHFLNLHFGIAPHGAPSFWIW
jgi:hypothetical protein